MTYIFQSSWYTFTQENDPECADFFLHQTWLCSLPFQQDLVLSEKKPLKFQAAGV